MKQFCLSRVFAALIFIAASQTAAAQTETGRAIRGTVYDSLDARPLAGAHVMLLDRSDTTAPPRSVVADSLGRFRFTGIQGGVYLIGFDDPLLDSLGISVAPRHIQLAAAGDIPLVVSLAVPGVRAVHDAFCPKPASADSTSVLIGHLSNASTRGIVASGTVTAQWLSVERKGKRVDTTWPTVTAQSRADGSYVLCGLPAATQLAVQAKSDSNASAVMDIVTPARTGVIRREIYLTQRGAVRGGVVTGIVRSARSKEPIARAQVRIAGDTTIATTGADGRFSLRDVPYGTLAIDARSIGYVPEERDVDVLADRLGSVTFSMASAANVLDTVRTYADVNDDNGFNARRKAGWGKYFDSNDIARMHAWDLNDVARGVPGVQVTGLGFHAVLLMRTLLPPPMYCVPTYYLDGRQLAGVAEGEDLDMLGVRPQDLSGVEIYADPTEAPPQFRPMFAVCGTVLMWTFASGHHTSSE